jgi:peptidoglycan/LPS O-acetylase OafA/YrhL
MVFVIKKMPQRGISILTCFTIGSFAISILGLTNLGPKFAFYFPICRFWEMSIGGILAYQKLRIPSKLIVNSLSIVGLSSILFLVYILDNNSSFPGFWALIPTISTAFIILAGQDSLVNKYILSSRLFVFIGKISYPMYLWHWPLLVYSRRFYAIGSTSIYANSLTMIIITITLSIFTYFLI